MLSGATASVCRESLQAPPETDQSDNLQDISPDDKPWDVHKLQAVRVAGFLAQGDHPHRRQAERMHECAETLEFGWIDLPGDTGETKLRLKQARFCRVRHCPICQWRRSLMWISRFYRAFPKIYADHPDWRYIMLTLTVRNCSVFDLRRTVMDMNAAWKRMIERKVWPAVGFVRSLEITRSELGEAHPHFHCLLAVPPGYFVGRKYLSTAKWAALWQEALRIDYTPICEVHTVKPKTWSKHRQQSPLGLHEVQMDEIRNAVISPEHYDLNGAPRLGGPAVYDSDQNALQPTAAEKLIGALIEVIKYPLKPDDMLADPFWLIEISSQLRNSRAVAIGGELKRYLNEDEPENLVTEDQDAEAANIGGVHFGWRDQAQRYKKLRNQRQRNH